MAYVATRRLRWGDGYIECGDCVPEREAGRNYAQLLRLGMIKEQEQGNVSAPAAPEAEPEQDETAGHELTCEECGFQAKSAAGLMSHRRTHWR